MKINLFTTGKNFPYPYYISVLTTFRAYGDDLTLQYLERPNSPYFDLLEKIRGLNIKKTDMTEDDFKKFPLLEKLSEHYATVAKFNYLAWKEVTENGGVIAGLSSVTLKRWDDLLPEDKEMLVPRDFEDAPTSYTSHGVCVRKGSKICQKIFEGINKVMMGQEIEGKHKAFDVNGNYKWGGIIPYLNNVYGHEGKEVFVLDVGIAVGINADHKEKGFYIYQNKDVGEFLHKDTRSIALYPSSDKGKMMGKIDKDYVMNSNTLYAELVKRLLLQRVWYR
jgi:hypothetical protein